MDYKGCDKVEKILKPIIYIALLAVSILIIIALVRGRLDGAIAVLSVGLFCLGVVKDLKPCFFRKYLLPIVVFMILLALVLVIYYNGISETTARVISVACIFITIDYLIYTTLKYSN